MQWIVFDALDRNSSLTSIVNGKTEDHLDMLDNMVIERLLNDKWSAFARVNLHGNFRSLSFSTFSSFKGQFRSSISFTWFTFTSTNYSSILTQSKR